MAKTPYELYADLVTGLAERKNIIVRKALMAALKNEDTRPYLSAFDEVIHLERSTIRDAVEAFRNAGTAIMRESEMPADSDR